MFKRAKPVRAWAVRKPRGKLQLTTIRRIRRDAMLTCGPATVRNWAAIREEGYRIARVTVTEDERK